MPVESNESPCASPGPVWTDERLKNPHAVADKQRRVRDMFAAIAPRYDLNNRLHSLGIDQRWRRAAVKLSRLKADDVVVDMACGTGDLTLAYARGLARARTSLRLKLMSARAASKKQLRREQSNGRYSRLLKLGESNLEPNQVVGIDYTLAMLPLAALKTQREFGYFHVPVRLPGGLGHGRIGPQVRLLNGDAQLLPLPDACCDVASIAFGIRNVADPMGALHEFRRVLRPGGRLVVLEFSRPTNPIIRRLYDFYCNQIMARTAAWIARDTTGAYRYLSASVETFKTREQMKADIESAGFRDVEVHPLTFGVAVIYVGFVKD